MPEKSADVLRRSLQKIKELLLNETGRLPNPALSNELDKSSQWEHSIGIVLLLSCLFYDKGNLKVWQLKKKLTN